jgi:hypothetical protein
MLLVSSILFVAIDDCCPMELLVSAYCVAWMGTVQHMLDAVWQTPPPFFGACKGGYSFTAVFR